MTVTTPSLAVHGGRAELDGLPDFPTWPQSGAEEERGILDVLHSGKWGSTHGDVVATFEQEFAQAQQARHAIALSNGTLALAAALRAAGVGVGDEVIVPPYTFIATAAAPLFVGAVPVFADVDASTHLLDPAATEAAITERTKAVMPVHLAGNVADMTAFAELGRRHGIAVIEDSAQAVGAQWGGRGVGTLGDLGTFSFQTSKNMSAGEGGIVTTDDDELAGAVYSLVNVGRVPGGGWYQHAAVGYNLRLTEFQGAILRAQLARLPEQQAVRETNARALQEQLAGVEGVAVAPLDPCVTAHGRHLFIFRVPELGDAGLRDAAARALAAEGVPGVSTGYVPLHRNAALVAETRALAQRLGQPVPEAACPRADQVSRDTLWLPQHVLLGSAEQVAAVGRAIAKVARSAHELA
ncbi:Glutamine--scyllo-inositol transaminase [Beutenbergia cavernae DSM 12333]|uniref:Glutamine--scyllo-inositol transaminase n=1 Tax=Beutenbergia cavernae (strain ATCC BAA-8 / DSM 12333 / CCUG 43141 / JCM 11478 / NBRC 16432 / NCIMB 13614 / HKI 0122) TaxID=471853 RepID=C5C1I0_BEUC1|nr:DegT/DnrJ/EryC1/StrS family aminotransferase [Beutenbergia cavernae]ACQ81590.1 Glutamine--scyllo-inositol transaminase [Beutenbergia cavernae DSM 12333]